MFQSQLKSKYIELLTKTVVDRIFIHSGKREIFLLH